MSNVDAVSSTSNYYKSGSSSTNKSNSDLQFEDFINLLASELKYQDPTDPVSSTEYVAQMAQFSSLSEMENIHSAMDSVQAYDMIGKSVIYQATDSTGETVLKGGTVDSVITSNGTTYLSVGGELVELSSVLKTANTDKIANSEAYSLIGKTVTYQTVDSAGKTTEKTGKVDSVVIQDGTAYLSVDGELVGLSSVVKVADSSSSS
ncbi:hypothetical protein P22_1423 [Propionispora sp. 2/2-37]|uniref:flagellar hook assembly protein FlgD n=1 Tax=Propionispora sp. 2/2-37 TaxID=1677858 RepID=UPI0006BB5A68|nr:flagellar hook capping FlgD N-terminal domain-containing protein [Propionispora sp. 2/2-37]CUH95353.1 hypothetical protein P22_1423 [Propionispora sp. 2/2-37]